MVATIPHTGYRSNGFKEDGIVEDLLLGDRSEIPKCRLNVCVWGGGVKRSKMHKWHHGPIPLSHQQSKTRRYIPEKTAVRSLTGVEYQPHALHSKERSLVGYGQWYPVRNFNVEIFLRILAMGFREPCFYF